MKYYFRFHRGSLDESLKTTQIFDDVNDMKDAIIHEYSPFMNITRSNVTIDETSFVDPRVDWPNCHHVTVSFNNHSKCCVGFVCIVDE